MSVPAGPPGATDAEGAGPPRADGRRWGARRTALTALAFLVVLVAAGVALWPGTGDHAAHAAATGGPTRAAAPSTTPQEPGTLIVSTRSIDLGRTGVQADFDLGNTGHLPMQYQVSTRTRWLRLTTIGGSLGAAGSARVTLLVDRTLAQPGTQKGSVLVSWDGGTLRIAVTLQQQPH